MGKLRKSEQKREMIKQKGVGLSEQKNKRDRER